MTPIPIIYELYTSMALQLLLQRLTTCALPAALLVYSRVFKLLCALFATPDHEHFKHVRTLKASFSQKQQTLRKIRSVPFLSRFHLFFNVSSSKGAIELGTAKLLTKRALSHNDSERLLRGRPSGGGGRPSVGRTSDLRSQQVRTDAVCQDSPHPSNQQNQSLHTTEISTPPISSALRPPSRPHCNCFARASPRSRRNGIPASGQRRSSSHGAAPGRR